jgi:hypothetical protein
VTAFRRALSSNRKQFDTWVGRSVRPKVLRVLKRADKYLAKVMATNAPGSFTEGAATSLRLQIADAAFRTAGALGNVMLDQVEPSVARGLGSTLGMLEGLEAQYAGVVLGEVPLNVAALLDDSVAANEASLLRRLVADGKPTSQGILQRYTRSTILAIEQQLQVGVLAGASHEEMVQLVTEVSPFLKGAPRYWAERLVRTELQGVYNRAALEGMQDLAKETDDTVKILSATFDNRTAWDSFMVHGQARNVNEPFDWFDYKGQPHAYAHPPNRPNDREVVVVWRLSWGPVPAELLPLPSAVYQAKFMEQYKKRPPPPRPRMSTIPELPYDANL